MRPRVVETGAVVVVVLAPGSLVVVDAVTVEAVTDVAVTDVGGALDVDVWRGTGGVVVDSVTEVAGAVEVGSEEAEDEVVVREGAAVVVVRTEPAVVLGAVVVGAELTVLVRTGSVAVDVPGSVGLVVVARVVVGALVTGTDEAGTVVAAVVAGAVVAEVVAGAVVAGAVEAAVVPAITDESLARTAPSTVVRGFVVATVAGAVEAADDPPARVDATVDAEDVAPLDAGAAPAARPGLPVTATRRVEGGRLGCSGDPPGDPDACSDAPSPSPSDPADPSGQLPDLPAAPAPGVDEAVVSTWSRTGFDELWPVGATAPTPGASPNSPAPTACPAPTVLPPPCALTGISPRPSPSAPVAGPPPPSSSTVKPVSGCPVCCASTSS